MLLLGLGGCVTQPAGECAIDRTVIHEGLDGTLWVQTSAEYQATTRTIYRQAMRELDRAIADPSRTAALEQQPPFADKPPAVILDVDETVFDNSPFQGQLALDGTVFSAALWAEWVDDASAEWVPGARAFIGHAIDSGVAVFYVTNRDAGEEAGTLRNFERLDPALRVTPEQILSKNEQDDWSSDKTTRRAHVADDYRVLLLVGDDLNDFFPARIDAAGRRDLARAYDERFGSDWFLLPNPLYGSWARALTDSREDCAIVEDKRGYLRGFR